MAKPDRLKLAGSNLSHFLYVDEAGISNKVQEPYLVCACIVVNADKKLIQVERHLEKLMKRHIPERLHGNFVFHAMEIFNGGKTLVRPAAGEMGPPEWPLERRLGIASDLSDIPRRFDLPIAVGHVERAKFPLETKLPEDAPASTHTLPAHAAAFMACAATAERWMRQNAPNEVAMLIVEDNDQARSVIRDSVVEMQNPRVLESLDESARVYFPFRKLKEEPAFQKKRPTSVLQVADFCAYVLKRNLMNEADPLYEQFLDPLRQQLIVF